MTCHAGCGLLGADRHPVAARQHLAAAVDLDRAEIARREIEGDGASLAWFERHTLEDAKRDPRRSWHFGEVELELGDFVAGPSAGVADLGGDPQPLLGTALRRRDAEGRVGEARVAQLRTHLTDFMAAYNFARRLKTLSGLTPYEYIAKIWTSEPDRFIVDPIHQMPGLNT